MIKGIDDMIDAAREARDKRAGSQPREATGANESIVNGLTGGEAIKVASEDSTTATSYDPAEHNVAEVKEYIEKNPDERDAVIAAERRGKARSTLLD